MIVWFWQRFWVQFLGHIEHSNSDLNKDILVTIITMYVKISSNHENNTILATTWATILRSCWNKQQWFCYGYLFKTVLETFVNILSNLFANTNCSFFFGVIPGLLWGDSIANLSRTSLTNWSGDTCKLGIDNSWFLVEILDRDCFLGMLLEYNVVFSVKTSLKIRLWRYLILELFKKWLVWFGGTHTHTHAHTSAKLAPEHSELCSKNWNSELWNTGTALGFWHATGLAAWRIKFCFDISHPIWTRESI